MWRRIANAKILFSLNQFGLFEDTQHRYVGDSRFRVSIATKWTSDWLSFLFQPLWRGSPVGVDCHDWRLIKVAYWHVRVGQPANFANRSAFPTDRSKFWSGPAHEKAR
ncbi:hypothetical protein E6C67_32345 [Azospirillum sp. TSA2s]|uniref:hypothetical protein n=1 Tax=Azospirillum sp. TSA2s TaxID=709810 RepID=UPI0010AB39D8|nr:hypothetical protein [Azospirillum sp. TSA2s]QCG98358.1 hypothetical protein E6C67_32345 [Azospirillum sp. TSA2s]